MGVHQPEWTLSLLAYVTKLSAVGVHQTEWTLSLLAYVTKLSAVGVHQPEWTLSLLAYCDVTEMCAVGKHQPEQTLPLLACHVTKTVLWECIGQSGHCKCEKTGACTSFSPSILVNHRFLAEKH